MDNNKGTKYCILENDGVGLCVCKHRPCEQLQRLKAENERLKKQYNCYACDSCVGKEDYINMKRHTENAIKTVHKYSQALQEIREIVDKAYYTEDYMLGQRFTELVDAINLTITNIGAE